MGPPKCPPALDRSAERDGSHILSRAPRGCGQFGLCPFAHALDLQGSGILVPLMAARRGCWSGPRHEETSSGRDTHSRSTFRSGSNLGSLLGCRDASACCCSETARLHRCRLRWARSSTPRAPRSRDIPWPTLSFSDVCRFLSGRPVQSEGARESSRLAGATLLVPQGGARDVGRRAHLRRCAAFAA